MKRLVFALFLASTAALADRVIAIPPAEYRVQPLLVAVPLQLRVPGWCTTPSVSLNGAPAGLITRDPEMLRICRMIEKVAGSTATVGWPFMPMLTSS